MLAALHQRNFAFLWFGQVISLIGDWVLFVALPFYVYSLTGSTLATGIMFIVQTIPSILFGSVAGVFVDRWDRKRTMLIANLAQAITLVPLFIVHSQQWIWVVYIFAFIEALISQFFDPAKSAIIPNLVDEEHLLSCKFIELNEPGTHTPGWAIVRRTAVRFTRHKQCHSCRRRFVPHFGRHDCADRFTSKCKSATGSKRDTTSMGKHRQGLARMG